MEEIPMRASIEEDRTFDHDESDYLLNAPTSESGVRFKRRRRYNFGIER